MFRITAFMTVLALASPAVAQAPAQAPTTAELETVVVDGRRLSDTIERFVDDIIAPPVGRGPSRWDEKVCVGVANLRPDAAQIIIDQVSRIALDAGLEPGDPGCSPNILVIATSDGQAMARGLVEVKRRVFLPFYAGGSRSARALERFQAANTPVRWWHVGVPVSNETGEIVVRLPGYEAPRFKQDGSRLTTRVRNDLRRAFVIVDLEKMEGVTFQQLGDYVGMVAMAQIDPEADTEAYDTVLNLFSDPRSVTGVTDWDRAYLGALYRAELRRRMPSHQGGEVAGLMLRDILRTTRRPAEE
ncbi:MAG TPA: hypothetical protein VFF48_00860 [Brevundimonas sp.]|nr:hypothetical protein [Brevundimonas sp.]